jgi:hypothetical protein
MPEIINTVGFPFTSVGGDRATGSGTWREYFDKLLIGHIVADVGNELEVKPQAVPNKSIYVDTGAVFIIGAMLVKASAETLSIADNISGNPRIDRIVARINFTERKIELAVKQGTPSASPIPPALIQDDSTYYEASLAKISLANGFSTITSGEITSEREDEAVCGFCRFRVSNATPTVDGLMTAEDKTKLNGIESGATGDQTGSEIKALYEAQANTNAYNDSEKTKVASSDSHRTNTSNPHGITKSQVALGSVQNYGIATQAEAEAGSVDNKYLTPLKGKQLYAAQNLGKYTEVSVSADYSPGNQGVNVTFDVEDNDDLGMWSSGDPTKIIIPAGVSLVCIYGKAPGSDHSDSSGERILLNGDTIAVAGDKNYAGIYISAIPVSQGDYIQLYHYGSSSATIVDAGSKLRVVVLK